MTPLITRAQPAYHHLLQLMVTFSTLSTISLLFFLTVVSSSYEKAPHSGQFPVRTLHNGNHLPLVGLGCASGVGEKHVLSAIYSGYRFFDTAQSYQWGYKEDQVGDAVQKALTPSNVRGSSEKNPSLSRNDIFLQSKIHPEDLGYSSTKRMVKVSLERLKTSYLDSMLIHKPHCWEGACRKEPEGTWKESWTALEEFYDSQVVRAIGICDVHNGLWNDLMQQRIKPHIIQNWMDPFHQDKHMRKKCAEEGIQYQAYSTLGSQWVYFKGYKENPVLTNPTLKSIAQDHNVSVAQVVINWATRHGVSVLPASTNSDRQVANLNSFEFDLTDEEMRAIDDLDGNIPPLTSANAKKDKKNPDELRVTFYNPGTDLIHMFWKNGNNQKPVAEIVAKGESSVTSFHGHKFVFKDQSGTVISEHVVAKNHGEKQRHVVEIDEL